MSKLLKVVAFNGSPRANGNTAYCLKRMLDIISDKGIKTELVQIGNKKIEGCSACRQCKDNKYCIKKKDIVNESIDKMRESDGIILGSPVYFAGMSGNMKNFVDRVGYCFRNNCDKDRHNDLYRKVGCGISVNATGGAANTYSQMNYFFGINEMIIPSSVYWNLVAAYEPKTAEKDKNAMFTIDRLAENMVWVMEAVRDKKEKTN
ncbi:nad(p)h-dependent fmn-containing oxidoreductase ywqn-related [Anaeramoeba ignava]|uniref:Nad(P)h-dependent fmn-containing oxidoreductase ywqn-related n=1 Tax=Anaeramoeba ignava TaxID=1746090 RepID=A0A9Q0R7G5_ANAIG|nr:nad(p)h-dependent fmn-containing oxidoreductase ywqn-related [Anaeramoeba ignava]